MRLRHVVVPAVAVVLLGCTPGGGQAGAGATPRPAAGERAPVQPRWTRVELPKEALLSDARVAFDGGVLAGTDRLPHMVAGVAAEPGAPDRVRIWTSDDTRRWLKTTVTLRDGADAWVAGSATDGRVTALIGTTWTVDGGVQPFVLRSSDRRAWEEAPLPEQALQRRFNPQQVVAGAGALLVVGVDRDERPVAVHVRDDGGEVVNLPAPEEGVDFGAFEGVVADGDVTVALAYVNRPGQPTHPVTYRSTDRGVTWRMRDGPGSDDAGVTGVARAGNRFVATGWVRNGAGQTDAAAWSSTDGRRWTAEDVPTLDDEDDSLSTAAVRGGRLVAAVHRPSSAGIGMVMNRDASGRWSVGEPRKRWIAPGGGEAVAPLADGSVLMARWARNSGTIGVIGGGSCGRLCSWTTALDTIGPDDAGMGLDELARDGDVPILVGSTPIVTVRGGSWSATTKLRRFSFTDDATIAPAEWDPPDSAHLSGVAVASDDSGATALLGGTNHPRRSAGISDDSSVVGWFRSGPDAAWKQARGLTGPRTEFLTDAFWLDGLWVAVGEDRDTFDFDDHERGAVWTSADGVRWRRQPGPFDVASDRDSWADGACRLPDAGGGDLVVVGAVEAKGHDGSVPLAWRQTGDRWTRIGSSALGDGRGFVFSCARRGDVTVLQGVYNGRATLWRTTDGLTFERRELGSRGEAFEPVRSMSSGFAAAGTRSADGNRGAVVWLSSDGETWRAVPVPSERPLRGWDVLDWDGRLVVAATSPSDPEVWILENPADLLTAANGGS